MFSPQSASENSTVLAILSAEATTLLWVSGTIFGREVVPEVWRMSATSSGAASPGRAAVPLSPPEREKAPATRPGVSVSTRIPSFLATSIAGDALPAPTTSALAPRSLI